MTKSITDAVENIQALAKALAGIRAAPARPTDATGAWPAVLSYIGAVDVSQQSATHRTRLFTIVTEIHVPRKDLSRDVAKLDPYPTAFPDAVFGDVTLSGAVDTVLSCKGQLLAGEWGGIETLKWAFNTQVKIT
jgi:hypothetical protein